MSWSITVRTVSSAGRALGREVRTDECEFGRRRFEETDGTGER